MRSRRATPFAPILALARATAAAACVLAILSRAAYAQPAQPPPAAAPKLTKPPRVVRFVEADYPPQAKAERRTATVVLRVTIAASGTVDEAVIVESAGADFDAAAVLATKQFLFEPAEIDGKPAQIRILYRYAFTLKEETPTTAVFEGVVRDRSTQRPLAGVEISVEGGPRTTTDGEGRFALKDVPPGKHAVTLSGEKTTAVRTEETFEAGKRLEASYDVAAPAAGAPPGDGDDLEIVVTAPSLDKHVVATEVSAEEARRMPGTQGDVLKVIDSMPGVARAQVGSGALVVWGAAPEDTRVYVDGVRIPRLYHGGGLRSVLATDLVDGVELAPGGYGAAYGRGLGGLVTIRTRRPNADRLHASASVDLLDAAAALRTPVAKNVAMAIAVRRSHLHHALEPFTDGSAEDFFPIPRYEDAQARVAWQIAKNERVDLTGLHSSDEVSRVVTGADPLLDKRDTRQTSFQRLYARYERDLNGGAVSFVPWIGFDRTRREDRFGGVPAELAANTTLYGIRASYRGKIDEVFSVGVGLDAEINDASLSRSGSIITPPREGDVRVFGQIPQDRLNADAWKVVTAGLSPYAELDAALFGGNLHVTPGLRFDPYFVSVSRKTPAVGETPSIGSYREDAAIEPRLAVRWQAFPRLALRGAYGRYHQLPAAEDLSAVFGNPLLPVSAADHFVAGSALRLLAKTALEATTFVVLSTDLSMRNPSPSPMLAEALQPIGEGRSYGAQMLLRQDLARGVSGWVSYAIVRSERKDRPDAPWRPSDFDQSHVLSAVGSVDLGKGFEVGARVRYATGSPRTAVVAAIYDTRRDAFQPLFGPKNRDRIPSFFQLDVRGSKRFKLPYGQQLEAYLEIQNVTDRSNPEEVVYSSSYREKGYVRGLPFLPVAGLRWEL